MSAARLVAVVVMWSSEGDSIPNADGRLDLLERRHQRQAEVACAALAEGLARTDHDAVLEQSRQEGVRGQPVGHAHPEVDRALAARDDVALARQETGEAFELGAEDL